MRDKFSKEHNYEIVGEIITKSVTWKFLFGIVSFNLSRKDISPRRRDV